MCLCVKERERCVCVCEGVGGVAVQFVRTDSVRNCLTAVTVVVCLPHTPDCCCVFVPRVPSPCCVCVSIILSVPLSVSSVFGCFQTKNDYPCGPLPKSSSVPTSGRSVHRYRITMLTKGGTSQQVNVSKMSSFRMLFTTFVSDR